MREPDARYGIFGILAEFDHADRLMEAVKRARRAGFSRIDAYSPFPIEGLAEEMDFHDRRVPILTLIGGIVGAAAGFGMQVYTNLAFPINIGGRPLIAWQAFMLITFELMVLFAVFFSVFGMLLLNHLPRLHYPVFDIESFHLATTDKFFLIVFSNDERFDARETRRFLESLAPIRVDTVGRTEEPE